MKVVKRFFIVVIVRKNTNLNRHYFAVLNKIFIIIEKMNTLSIVNYFL